MRSSRRPTRGGEHRQKPRPDRVSHAVQGAPDLRTRLTTYGVRHLQVGLASLGRLVRAPISSLMTAAVIGIALALPSGLYVLLQNAQSVSGGWDGAAQISLFLKPKIDSTKAKALSNRLRTRPEVETVRYISPDEALEEFSRLSGFGDALEALEQNPLPAVLVVQPAAAHSDIAAVDHLLTNLRELPEVDMAQLDMQWVQRLYAIMELAKRGILVVAALLSLAVLLVVGNTIRLDIQNRRDEIVITKLIGATDAFIRRPFLYSGLWYGIFGGVIAGGLVNASVWLLQGPTQRLAGLYHSAFELAGLDPFTSIGLLAASATLGLTGSWLAVARHLNAIEPT